MSDLVDPIYTIPDDPVYDTEIREIQDNDDVSASKIINPVISKIINNTHFVKKLIESLPKTYISETEPENWKAGDAWHKVLRTRIVPDATEIYAQMLETTPYDPQRMYSIETDGTKETVTNLESEEYTIKEI